jgi:tetratricopeptide (TPR) repeat protein
MKKPVFIMLLVCLSSLTAGAGAPAPGPYAAACITAILDCRYDIALSITDSAEAADTNDPLAPLLRLAMIGMRDVDFDTLIDTADFFCTFRRTENLVERYERNNGISSYSRMLSGLSKGIHSSFLLRRGSYLAALQNGFEALDILNEAARLDPANADPLFLPGLYDYARGEIKKQLWWVMFWYPGSKERGIARLSSCSKQGVMTGKASLFVLAEIYNRENKPEECRKIIAMLERDFPQSRFFLWQKISYLESQRLFYEASLACILLDDSYSKTSRGEFNSLVVRTMRAHLLVRAGQKKEAGQVCRRILKTPQDKRKKPILKDAEKLLRSLDDR